MTEAFGSISVFLFIAASLFQAFKSFGDGHSRGISHASIWSLLIGYTGMIFYVADNIGWDFLLMTSYFGQLACWLLIAKYKYLERKDKTDGLSKIQRNNQR